mmetsp:Transcript_13917/g.44556  ORF Transcript_13917/g.44556 Transcript_13917/m.44556 type:complete len:275 (+) Transcript_13917:1263-2087(+)
MVDFDTVLRFLGPLSEGRAPPLGEDRLEKPLLRCRGGARVAGHRRDGWSRAVVESSPGSGRPCNDRCHLVAGVLDRPGVQRAAHCARLAAARVAIWILRFFLQLEHVYLVLYTIDPLNAVLFLDAAERELARIEAEPALLLPARGGNRKAVERGRGVLRGVVREQADGLGAHRRMLIEDDHLEPLGVVLFIVLHELVAGQHHVPRLPRLGDVPRVLFSHLQKALVGDIKRVERLLDELVAQLLLLQPLHLLLLRVELELLLVEHALAQDLNHVA